MASRADVQRERTAWSGAEQRAAGGGVSGIVLHLRWTSRGVGARECRDRRGPGSLRVHCRGFRVGHPADLRALLATGPLAQHHGQGYRLAPLEGHRQVLRAVVLHLFQCGQRNHRQQERALGIVPKISRYDTGRGTRNGPHTPTLGSTGTSWMDACIPHHMACGMIAGPAGRHDHG
jgi:hypothetical protein